MSTIPINNDVISIPESSAEIRDAILRDEENLYRQHGISNPPTQAGGEKYIEAQAIANAVLVLINNVLISANATSELTATGASLDNIREAMGLPEVVASPSSGRLVVSVLGSSAVLMVSGTEFTLPNGTRGKVYGNQTVADNGTVDVITIDTGSDTVAAYKTEAVWTSPPSNVIAQASVDVDGLTGGTDDETDERKRERILNRRRYLPAGGNPGEIIEIAEGATGAVQKCFVYPCAGGAGSAKVSLSSAMVTAGDTQDYSRTLGVSTVDKVAAAIHAKLPAQTEIVVESVANQDCNVVLQLAIPFPGTKNAIEKGWLDLAPFPPLTGSETSIVITSISIDKKTIIITPSSGVEPINNQTRVAWFDPVNREFVIQTVKAHTTAHTLVLDMPFSNKGNDAAVGDIICPGAQNMNSYRDTILSEMNKLGPGAAGVHSTLFNRASRVPSINDMYPSELTIVQLTALVNAHSEISDAQYTAATTPLAASTPNNASANVNVLRLLNFGIYPY